MRFPLRPIASIAALLLAASAWAQSPPPPPSTLVTNVHLTEDVDAPAVSILVVNGRIAQILSAGEELPTGVRVIDGDGALALPAFIDGWTSAGIDTPEPQAVQDAMSSVVGSVHIGMREANRKGLQPALRGALLFDMDEDGLDGYRGQGFGAVHSVPSGQLLAGQSVVATLRDGARRDRIVSADLFQSAALTASGGGYPSTLMGYMAHLRQFVLDARWNAQLRDRYAAGKLDRRPPFDPELEAASAFLSGEQRLLCRANDASDILRWIAFAEAQGVRIAICGGREAWRVTDQLVAAEVPVFLGLDWGDEVKDPDAEKDKDKEKSEGEEATTEEEVPVDDPEAATNPEAGQETPAVETPAPTVSDETSDDESAPPAKRKEEWVYEEPIEVRRERRRQWEERRDCALRLHDAGIPFAFGTGRQSPKDLLKNAGELIELGLPEDVALAALTTKAAELLQLNGQLGRLEVGYAGNLALWSDSPFAKKSHLDWLLIDGAVHEFEKKDEDDDEAPAEDLEVNGTWEVVYEDQTGKPALLELTMAEDGALEGTLNFETPAGSTSKAELSGRVSGRRLTLKGPIDLGNFEAQIRITGDIEGESMSGDATWKFSGGEDSNSFTARKKPENVWQSGGHDHTHPHGAEGR